MNNNSKAIVIFCSHLCVGSDVHPLEPQEWSSLAAKMLELGIVPENLLTFNTQDFIEILGEPRENAERMYRLLERSASLAFEIADYEAKGIYIVTRADENYPKKLKTKLKHSCPPLFYYAGDLAILQKQSIGYVGSRNIIPEAAQFTVDTVVKTVNNSFAVVSGGAKGVDSISSETALKNGGYVIEYLGESMLKRMKNLLYLEAVQNGQMVLLSAVNPNAGFKPGNLMARNKYIYAQSEATVIICSEKKGGTWTGANENLKHRWTPAFCWNKKEYEGNLELIKRGCISIDESWDGFPEVSKVAQIEDKSQPEKESGTNEQLLIPGFE